jgi:hypothetical protein
MRYILILTFLFSLNACSLFGQKTKTITSIENITNSKSEIVVDSSLLKKPRLLPLMEKDQTPQQLLEFHKQEVQVVGEMYNQIEALQKFVCKVFPNSCI